MTVLNHDHPIGAFRHHPAGGDPGGFARTDLYIRNPAHHHLPNQIDQRRKAFRGTEGVFTSKGIPIHGRTRKPGEIFRRNHVTKKVTPQGLRQGKDFIPKGIEALDYFQYLVSCFYLKKQSPSASRPCWKRLHEKLPYCLVKSVIGSPRQYFTNYVINDITAQ